MSQANAAYSQTRALVSAANEFHLARRAQREAARHDGVSERASERTRTGAQITTGARRAGNLIGLNYCLGSSAAPSIID